MAEEFHIDDVGTLLEVLVEENEVLVDISAATEKSIRLTRPDGTAVSYPASFTTDGTDGLIGITSGPLNDFEFDQSGAWYIQAHITLPNGAWSTETARFRVYPNLV